MEGIIIMVVLAIISSLFSNKKKQKEQKSMPPFNNKQNTRTFQQSTVEQQKTFTKSLEDFASEIFQQLNEKNKIPQEIFGKSVEKEVVSTSTVNEQNKNIVGENKPNKTKTSRPTLNVNRSSNRGPESLHLGNKTSQNINDKIKENEIGSYMPISKEVLIQSIITSEIIGPPKAKQH